MKRAESVSAGGVQRHGPAGQAKLQGLQQAHEVPHGEDVRAHEQAQRFRVLNPPVHGVIDQPVQVLPQRLLHPSKVASDDGVPPWIV